MVISASMMEVDIFMDDIGDVDIVQLEAASFEDRNNNQGAEAGNTSGEFGEVASFKSAFVLFGVCCGFGFHPRERSKQPLRDP